MTRRMDTKDFRVFRNLPINEHGAAQTVYDFTFDRRYVIYHIRTGAKTLYKAYDKNTGRFYRVYASSSVIPDKAKSLLIPFVLYAFRNEEDGTKKMQFPAGMEKMNWVDMIFRALLPQVGFSVREEQIKMAQAMLDGMTGKNVTLYEAGVGSGKTMSFLVAGFLASRLDTTYQYTQNPITIATSSIDLQEEMVNKELPKLSQALINAGVIDLPLQAVIRKGKEHYFCIKRYLGYMKELKACGDKYSKLRSQIEQQDLLTCGFDLDKVSLPNFVKRNICVGSSCRNCPQRIMCNYDHYVQVSRTRGAFDFQVTNHNMLLMSQKMKGQTGYCILAESNYYVIDEAHRLSEAINAVYGKRVCMTDIQRLYCLLIEYTPRKPKEYKLFNDNLNEMKYYCRELFQKAKRMMEVIREERVTMEMDSETIYIVDRIIGAIGAFNRFQLDERQTAACQQITTVLKMLKKKANVCWIEIDKSSMEITFESVSILPGEQVHKDLWNAPNTHWVLTSGTMRDHQGFEYYKNEVGISQALSKYAIMEGVCGSPFKYEEKTRLYIPQYLPRPDADYDGYITAISNEIIRLVDATYGHTAILFTSYRVLNDVYTYVEKHISSYPLFKMTRNNKNAIQAFKESGNGVIFASGSMWEGIDCAGDVLSSVIIVRLPFPIRSTMSEKKKAQYEDVRSFVDAYAVPQMLIKLRQGAGRLIRTENDSGVISILDARAAVGGSYHTNVVNVLNRYPLVHSIQEVNDFINRNKDGDYKGGSVKVA